MTGPEVVHLTTPDSDATTLRVVCGEPVTTDGPWTVVVLAATCRSCLRGVGDAETVADRVTEVERLRLKDDEAHAAEDALHRDVLRAIAEGRSSDPVAAAAAALRTRDLDFARWYA